MDKIYLPFIYKNISKKISSIYNNIYHNILISGFNGHIFGELIYDSLDYNSIDPDLHIFFVKQIIKDANICILCEKKQKKYYTSIQNYFNRIFNLRFNFNLYYYDNAYIYYEQIDNLINHYQFDLILQAIKNRRKNRNRNPIFTFQRANIPIDSLLTCTLNNEIVKVYNNRKIIDKNGNIHSLSGYVAPILLEKIHSERARFSGPQYFTYNGKPLLNYINN